MIKNPFLLRCLLLFGFFWTIKLVLEIVSFVLHIYVGDQINWFSTIGAAILAVVMTVRTVSAIEQSVAGRGKLTTTVRWVLYLMVGYGVYISTIKLVEYALYDDRGFWWAINGSGDGLQEYKGYFFLILAVFLAFFLTKRLVNQVGFVFVDQPNSFSTQQKGNVQLPKNYSPSDTNAINQSVRQANEKATIHGSAKWSDDKNFNNRHNKKTDREMEKEFEQISGYVLAPGRFKYLPLTNCITIAGSRQGKGTSVIMPNLLTKPTNSWVVLDIKGENSAVTARFQKSCGQNVFILDPFNHQATLEVTHGIKSSGFNPLRVVKNLPAAVITDFASMVAEIFIPHVQDDKSQDDFWVSSGRNTLKTYILHLLTEKSIDDADRHLGTIYEWLRLNEVDEVKLWVDMTHNPYTKFAINEIKSMAIKASETWAGVIANARKATSSLDSPVIQQSLKSNEFDPMLLENSNTTVYVVMPEMHLENHKAWIRLVFSSILKLCNYVAKRRVNFILDEFPKLGRMDEFLKTYAFGLGQQVSCWLFAQNLTQLKDKYGEDGMNEFLSNSQIKQFFGMSDLYTMQYVSDMLGQATETMTTSSEETNSGSSTNNSSDGLGLSNTVGGGSSFGTNRSSQEHVLSRKLLMADEVRRLKGRFILFVEDHVYNFEQIHYYEQGLYTGRHDDNPYFKRQS